MTASVQAEDPAPKRGIDYSKFDQIEDSDDDKPQTKTSATPTKPAEVEKPHCANCHKDIQKPLRCGVCKKVSYCSPQCQKGDWQFHKRNCKKPEEPKAKEPAKKPVSEEAKARREKKREEEKVVDNDNDDIGIWYRHREWKPTVEPKKEFRPVKVEGAVTDPVAASPSAPAAGSAWNSAGTWEEKDVTEMAKKTLGEKLSAFKETDIASGVLSASADSVEGEASKPVIRGKLRHFFDLSFKVKFIFKWMDSDGQKQAEGTVSISDFTNDTFAEGVLSAPVVELSFKDAKKLDASRRHVVEAGIGAGQWPPSGGLMEQVSSKMKAWAEEYEQLK
eukprot:CAMPEP_0197659708 /NCGR_PEP_ID=MMETSP1338-20131121/48740_1 /TAXON_ID=43686 ORGANISM="Pelagodinium beii, Strain RCC1491" /NCGR_SAMPLE_ID=MMETSP1338 /ASSEMBLY_ACC=CAM_ASM_000754 /LENGTH=332 /DNA_ID=CAMNT_0043236755 /DNA_START=74 /DNA_END=1072 /DNA_ORIENTATION=+